MELLSLILRPSTEYEGEERQVERLQENQVHQNNRIIHPLSQQGRRPR